MAFAKTGPFVPGALPAADAAWFNKIEQAIDDLYNKTGFLVYRNAAFSASDGTQLQFDTTEYDPDGLYKMTVGDPNRFAFVCPKSGLWHMFCQYTFAGSPVPTDSYLTARLWRNPASNQAYFDGPRIPSRGTYGLTGFFDRPVYLAQGDIVDARVSTAAIAAAALQVGGGAVGMPTCFSGRLVRPV